MSKREQVLNALFARLSALPDVEVKRNAVLPVKIPDNGLVVLRDGDIVEQGSHDELMALGGFYSELYNSQFDQTA